MQYSAIKNKIETRRRKLPCHCRSLEPCRVQTIDRECCRYKAYESRRVNAAGAKLDVTATIRTNELRYEGVG